MQLHTLTVFYRRQAQPAQYETEEVRLEGSATVEDGEDFEAVAYDLLTRARIQAHRALGLKEPTIAEFNPAFEGGWHHMVYTAPTVAFGDADQVSGDAATTKGTKRKRRTKAEMEAAKAAEAKPEEVAEELPVVEDAAQSAEASKALAGDDFVIGEPEPAAEIDDKQLQADCAAAAKRLGSAEPVKGLMREYKVARLGELAQAQRSAFLAALSELKPAA